MGPAGNRHASLPKGAMTWLTKGSWFALFPSSVALHKERADEAFSSFVDVGLHVDRQ